MLSCRGDTAVGSGCGSAQASPLAVELGPAPHCHVPEQRDGGALGGSSLPASQSLGALLGDVFFLGEAPCTWVGV